MDDELYVKRLQKRPKYKLISDNKSYDDIELE
ncbi:S24 family peptidase, partial [Helicobacter trogontum]